MNEGTATRVAVVGGARTPFVKAGTVFRKYSALDLGVHSVNGLLKKQRLDPHSVDELVYGITVVDPRVPHMAREVVFSSELPAKPRSGTQGGTGSSSSRAVDSGWGARTGWEIATNTLGTG